MKMIPNPNNWSCVLAAFAMAMEVTTEELVKGIGHDGSQVAFPGLGTPNRLRGFHTQELIVEAIRHGFSATPLERVPVIASPMPDIRGPIPIPSTERDGLFGRLVFNERGVLTGVNDRRIGHAVAFDRGQVFDPAGPTGRIYPFSFENCERRNFYAQCAWVVKKC